MLTKEYIICEIKRIAKEEGKTPGKQHFKVVTGIRESDWCPRFWRDWGSAREEAGFEREGLQRRIPDDELIRKFAEAFLHFGRYPVTVDLRMYAKDHEDFPSSNTLYGRFGSKVGLLAALSKWVRCNEDFADLIKLIPEPTADEDKLNTDQFEIGATGYGQSESSDTREGFVYLGLLKIDATKRYKIGKTNLVERRGAELSLQLPEKLELIHYIKTDDMDGIEQYWHKRFKGKNTNGEWFNLSAADLKVFRQRKVQ